VKRSDRIEWLLRILVFGSALIPGVIAAWSIWVYTHSSEALALSILAFLAMYVSIIYIVKRRKLKMLQT
jgi:hypothetical protein